MTGVSLFFLSSCTQSGGTVKVHNYGGSATQASLGMHTIKKGETLWSIANGYHVDLRDLLDLNRLSPPYDSVKAGKRIQIPAPRTYRVRKGDTLYRVSRMFDSTTTDMARLNSMKSPYVLQVGQDLRLPTVRRSYTKTAPASQRVSSPDGRTAVVGSVQSEVLQPVPPGKPEVKQAVAVTKAPPARSGKGFLMPVSGRVVSTYGAKANGLHNDGINIKAPRGTAVRAADNGTVVYAGDEIKGYGNLVLVRHQSGYMTAYAHLDKMLVKKGSVVKRGYSIGTVGSTGHVETPQLHFEIRKGKKALNPQTLVN